MVDLMRTAAWFFVAQGAFYLIIGLLTPAFLDRGQGFFFSHRSDSGYFGQDVDEMRAQDPNLWKLRDLVLLALAGLLAGIGVAVAAMAWFALRTGQPWAYWSLLAVGAIMVPYWMLVLGKYLGAQAPVGLGDVPPFMWVTTLLWALGAATGAFGLRA